MSDINRFLFLENLEIIKKKSLEDKEEKFILFKIILNYLKVKSSLS